jgi:hypothetical protein
MSLLACDRDPKVLQIVVDGCWNTEALSKHLLACRACASLQSAMAAATGFRGGASGRGAAKRRGDADYYRALAVRSWRTWTTAQGVEHFLDQAKP